MQLSDIFGYEPTSNDAVGLRITIEVARGGGGTRNKSLTVNVTKGGTVEDCVAQALDWAESGGLALRTGKDYGQWTTGRWWVTSVVEGGFSNPAFTC